MSTLKVGTIQDHANSNTAISIASDGQMTFPKPPIGGAKLLSETPTTLSGNEVSFAIPSGVDSLTLQIWGASQAANNTGLRVRLGVGGSIVTSGYQALHSYAEENSETMYQTFASKSSFHWEPWTNNANVIHGQFQLRRLGSSGGSHYWNAMCINYSTPYANTGGPGYLLHVGGHITLTGELDKVYLGMNGSTFDAGMANVILNT